MKKIGLRKRFTNRICRPNAEGKPATEDIKDPYGAVMDKAGHSRDGGSFEQRMGNVACWNTVMDEDRYMIQRWNDFISA